MSPTPTTIELVALGAPIALRDGSHACIRQGHRSDRELLLRGFERLSPESRYRRFLAARAELSEPTGRYLTEIDHHDHEAMIALDEETGAGLGVARYVRDPDHPDMAELAVTVIDDWQGRGLGTLLLEVISARAHVEGISRFTAVILATNREMMDVLEDFGPVRILDRKAGTVEVEVPIPAGGPRLSSRDLDVIEAAQRSNPDRPKTGFRPPPGTCGRARRQHQKRAAGHAGELPRGASVQQATDPAVATRAHDQQVE
jgi:GNAT superfamily N-acetyltransferase